MTNEELEQIIKQIKKYNLTNAFAYEDEFKKWISSLTKLQIKNFLALNIDFEEIKPIKFLLINKELLNCKDYINKVEAISKLKNGEGSWHLFYFLCTKEFLKSDKFYQDIDIISKADDATNALCLIGKKEFINSPYHDEDLKLINSKQLDSKVSGALATVAGNINSIKSIYHQDDMKLIAEAGSNCLHTGLKGLDDLACNERSLKDPYHLENMKILTKNLVSQEFLYLIMTNKQIIKGKNYRKEVEALVNAKSERTARALYYYIVNPEGKFGNDYSWSNDYVREHEDACFETRDLVAGNQDVDYINNLARINEIDDAFVLHYVSLLMNTNFIKSPNKIFDLELLKTISDKPIFMSLYDIMHDQVFLNSIHHKMDSIIISQTKSAKARYLLKEKATDKTEETNENHEYDMKFISQIDFDLINGKTYDLIYHYLFDSDGKNSLERLNILERVKLGEMVDKDEEITAYFNNLAKKNEKEITDMFDNVLKDNKPKTRAKILRIFKR